MSKQKQSCVNQIHNPSEKKHRTFGATPFGLKETDVFWGVLSSVLLLILDLFSIFYDVSCIVMQYYELNNWIIERNEQRLDDNSNKISTTDKSLLFELPVTL